MEQGAARWQNKAFSDHKMKEQRLPFDFHFRKVEQERSQEDKGIVEDS